MDPVKDQGFAILEDIYTSKEIEAIIGAIHAANVISDRFRRTKDLFAIRKFLHEIPSCRSHIFTPKFQALVRERFGSDYFAVQSIYFDKPASSNWFVSWHQDLTISVDKKIDLEGFANWTVKQGQFSVQPSLGFLENIFTVRIHLDDTDQSPQKGHSY